MTAPISSAVWLQAYFGQPPVPFCHAAAPVSGAPATQGNRPPMHLVSAFKASQLTRTPVSTVDQDWPALYPGLLLRKQELILIERRALQDLIADRDPRVLHLLAYHAFLDGTECDADDRHVVFWCDRLSELEPNFSDGEVYRTNMRVRSSSVRRVIDAWNGGER